jgi:hypothetical protein
VTALFRHPLGLPIPHGDMSRGRKRGALGSFVANHVITRGNSTALARLDLPGICTFLADPQATRPAAQALAGLCPGCWRPSRTADAGCPRLVPRCSVAPDAGVSSALRQLVDGGRHQGTCSGFVLGQLKTMLAERRKPARPPSGKEGARTGRAVVSWALGADRAARCSSCQRQNWRRWNPTNPVRAVR